MTAKKGFIAREQPVPTKEQCLESLKKNLSAGSKHSPAIIKIQFRENGYTGKLYGYYGGHTSRLLTFNDGKKTRQVPLKEIQSIETPSPSQIMQALNLLMGDPATVKLIIKLLGDIKKSSTPR